MKLSKFTGIFALFFLFNIITFSAIQYSSTSELKSQAKVQRTKTNQKEFRVVYMPPATEYNYYRTIGKGIEDYSKDLGVKYNMLAPQIDNPANQFKLLKNVVSQDKADIIIFATHNPVLVAPMIKEAVSKGIVVVLVNSDVPDFNTAIHAVVGYNQRKGAKKMGEYVSTLNKKKVNVGILEGAPGYHSTERVEGFLAGIKSNTNLKVVSNKNGGWNVVGGFNATLEMLKENPNIKVIFAANDYEIIGAMSAAKVLNKDGITFLGNDGDDAALEKISNQELDATLNTTPFEMGKASLQVAVDILKGKFDGGFIETPTEVVDSGNIKNYYKKAGNITVSDLKNKKLTVMTEEYKDLSERSGRGLYFEILNEIYKPYGIKVEHKIVPFVRAIKTLQGKTDDVDMVLGGFPGALKNIHFPQWHYNIDIVSVLFDSNKINWKGEDSMANMSVAMMRNYNLNQYLFTEIKLIEKNQRAATVKMVTKDRVDFFLDVKSETLKSLDNLRINTNSGKYKLEDLFQIRQYLCFRDDAKGHKLAEIFDNEFPRLIESGKLKEMFDKWQVEYPF